MDRQNRIVAEETTKISPIISIERREMLSAAAVGFGAGLITAGAYFLLERFVFHAVMCRPDTAANCTEAPTYAMVVAMVVGGLAGLVALVQARVYRPLLVVLAVAAAYWGFQTIMAGFAWYWVLVLCGVLFALGYALFTWMARIRAFPIAAIITIVLVVIIRYALTSL